MIEEGDLPTEEDVTEYLGDGGVGRPFVARRRRGSSEYRRVGKYYKSSKRYQLERKRRQQVIKLHTEGLTLAQISVRLGVSVRTVKRDFAKVKPFLKNQGARPLEDEGLKSELHQLYAGLENLSLSERHTVLCRLLETFLPKQRKKRGKSQATSLSLTIDLDAALKGGPTLLCTPPHLTYSGKQLTITVQLLGKGELANLGTLTLTRG